MDVSCLSILPPHQGIASVHLQDDNINGRGVVGHADTVASGAVLFVVETDHSRE